MPVPCGFRTGERPRLSCRLPRRAAKNGACLHTGVADTQSTWGRTAGSRPERCFGSGVRNSRGRNLSGSGTEMCEPVSGVDERQASYPAHAESVSGTYAYTGMAPRDCAEWRGGPGPWSSCLRQRPKEERQTAKCLLEAFRSSRPCGVCRRNNGKGACRKCGSLP